MAEDHSKSKVWIALSVLFLDTDISIHIEHISRVCADSNFDLDELSAILYREVAPVCMPNLLTIAGEWAGFDEAQLVEKILEYKNKSNSGVSSLFKPQWGFIAKIYIGQDWRKVVELIKEKRNNASC